MWVDINSSCSNVYLKYYRAWSTEHYSGIFNWILTASVGDQILNIYVLNISDRCTGLALLSAVLWVLCSTTSFCSHVCVASPKESPCSKAVDPPKPRARRTHGASPSSSKHKLYKQTVSLLSPHRTHTRFTTHCAHAYTLFFILLTLHPEPGRVEPPPTSPSPHPFRLHDLERGFSRRLWHVGQRSVAKSAQDRGVSLTCSALQ